MSLFQKKQNFTLFYLEEFTHSFRKTEESKVLNCRKLVGYSDWLSAALLFLYRYTVALDMRRSWYKKI